MKALVLHLQEQRGRADADALLQTLRVERDYLEDETRLITVALWYQALVWLASRLGHTEISNIAGSIVHPDNLGVWSKVLRGAEEPDAAFAQLGHLGGDEGPTELWSATRLSDGRWSLEAPSLPENLEADGLCGLARAAELAAVPLLFGKPRALVKSAGSSKPHHEAFLVELSRRRTLQPVGVAVAAAASGMGGGLLVGIQSADYAKLAIVTTALGVLGGGLWVRQLEKSAAFRAQQIRIQTLERSQGLRDARDRRAAPFRPNAVVAGQYRLLQSLGSGGSGAIWEAERISDGATVAVKLLRTAVAHDGVAAARLRREAAALGLTWHPNVVEVYEDGILEDGTSYLVMERLFGESLLVRLRRSGKLTPTEVFPIALGVCDALQAVHAAGVVHRDVKPSNIFLADISAESEKRLALGDPNTTPLNQRVKLLDFGVAQVAWAETRLTNSGTPLGTPGYMSPEQEQGLEIDARSDLFSLGGVLYECLTGTAPPAQRPGPLDASPATTRDSGVQLTFSRLEPGWRTLIERAMAPATRDRIPDARTFRAVLLELQRNSTSEAHLDLSSTT